MTSPDGAATAETVRLLEEMSKTGVAYITIGDTQVDLEHDAAYAGELNVSSDLYLGSLYSVVEAIHRYGAKASEVCRSSLKKVLDLTWFQNFFI